MGSDTAGSLLTLLMRRRGWNPYQLSQLTRGRVSASSIRAYAADRSRPRPDKALALARVMGTDEGEQLLRLLGYDDLAAGFVEEASTPPAYHHDPSAATNYIHYTGRPLSETSLAMVNRLIAWLQATDDPPTRGR